MKFEKPSLIALDLDGTIYDFSTAQAEAMKQAAEILSSRLGIRQKDWQADFDWARGDVKQRLGQTASSHSRLLYFKTMLEKLGVGGHFDLALQLETSYWNGFLRAMEPAVGAREFLEHCRFLGLPVVLMTDLTLQIQLRKVIQLGFQTFVDGIVSSEEVGHDKPDINFLKYAQQNLDLRTDSTWVIGDDLEKDKALADSMGADFFHVSANERSEYSFKKITFLLRKDSL